MKRSPAPLLCLLFVALVLALAPAAHAQQPVPGTLLSFDGTEGKHGFVQANLNLGATSITVEAWVRRASAGTNDFIFSYGADAASQGLTLGFRSNNVFVLGFDGGNDLDTPVAYTDTGWHHWAGVYDRTNGNRAIYRDGELVASDVAPAPFTEVASPELYLGDFFAKAAHDFHGEIDELRIWNVARTGTEVREGMHRTMTGTEPGLVAYWQFNEGSGSTATAAVGGYTVGFSGTPVWAPSLVPVAGGMSVTQTEAAGPVDFSAAGVTMNYTAQSGASVTVTRLDAAPAVVPGTRITPLDAQYWAFERFGAGPFTADVTFTVSEDLTAADAADPGRIKLFRRASTATGETWGAVASATSVDAVANTATFTGITAFSQFLLGRSGTPDPAPGTRLAFDGSNDYVDVASKIPFGTAYTVEGWIRTDGDAMSGAEDLINGANPGGTYLLVEIQTSGQLRYLHRVPAGSVGGTEMLSTATVNDGAWHHVAAVMDGAEMRLYIDGVLETSAPATTAINDEVKLYLGSLGSGGGRFFGGAMEEMRVWNVARTAAEIREGMHRTLAGSEAGLVAYWQFNEATGSTAADVAGGHDAVLVNGTAWATSDVPASGGVSVTQTEAAGPVDFSAAGVTMNYTAQSGAPVTVIRLDDAPSSLPTGGSVETVLDSQYWVVERFGAGAFSADVTFTVSEDLTGDVPGRLLLFRRDSRAGADAPWEQVGAASALDAGTRTVTFTGLTAFSQFVIVRAPAAETVPGTLLSLDGTDDYVQINHSPDFAFDRDSSYTVETWVRYTGTGGTGSGAGAIIEKWDGGAASYPFVVRVNRQEPGQVHCAVWDQSKSATAQSSRTDLNDGAWHHLACVHDGVNRTLTLFVDGEPQEVVSTASMGSLANTHPIYFGRRGSHLNEWFGGDLEEVRIWRAARTETEVREGMHRTMTGTEPGLVAYWQLNEGAGTTAADIVGGHDATLNGGAAWGTSDTPVGGGASASATAAFGPVDFSAAGVTMTFTENTTADPITVTRLDLDPFDVPGGTDLTFLDGQYWVVERFGAGPFTADVTFTVDGLMAADTADPGRLKLLRRDGRAVGGTWSVVAHGASVDAGAGTVTFPGVTGFSQFALARGGTPGTVAGTAADLSGGRYADVGDLGDFGRRLRTASVSFWMQSTSATPGSIMKVAVDPASPTAPVFAIEANRLLSASCTVGTGAGATLFYVRDSAGRVLARHITTDLYDGAWHHVAWVLEDATANQMTVYVDGVAQPLNGTCSQAPATFTDWGQPLFLGAASSAGTATDYASLTLDEVRLWTTARTAEEVRATMHHARTGQEAGLVAYWQFNEGTGTTGTDVVGGHDAALVGGTAWPTATYPFGPGVFAQKTEQNGLVDFTGTGLTASYLSHSASAVGVSRIDQMPVNPPSGASLTVIDDVYWVMTRYTGGPFSADLTFAVEGLTAADEATPGQMKLFRREAAADGTWRLAASATATDATAGTVTFSGVTNSGQFVVVRGQEAPALAGTALDFDGTDDYVKLNGLVVPNTFTLEMWINPQSATDNRAFVSKDYGADSNGFGSEDLFNVGFYKGQLRVFLRNRELLAGPQVTGQQHLAVVVEQTGTSSLVTVYRNGLQIAQGTLAATLDDDGTGADWTFGQNWVLQALAKTQADPPAADFFDGTLDEVRFWTTARTAEEIRTSMHEVFGGTVDGLLSYWQFNQGSGTTAIDLVAGHDGTLVGGTAWVTAGAPVGEAVVTRRLEADGVVDFAGTGLQVDYAAQGGATVYVTHLDGAPNTLPAGVTDVFDSQYWVVERFGPGTFTADLVFTPSEAVDGFDELLAGRLKLYHRTGSADGAWSPAAAAAEVNPFTGTVTFRRLSTPGQYLLARSDARALDLDGVDDAVTTTLTDDLDSWTLEAWVKADAAPTGAKTTALVERGTNYALYWDHPDPTARGAAALTIGGTRHTASFGTLEAGRWYHLAASYDGETLRAYRNGALVTENEAPSGAPDADASALVMGRHDATGEHFAGLLDEVRLWDLFRPGDRILADMQHTLAGDETGLAGYWRFDLPVGAGARDLTDGGHDAAFTGDPVLTPSGVPADLVFPGDVAATDAVFEDRTEITWPALGLPDVTVAILRDGTQIAVAASDQTFYADVGGTRGTVHTYCLVLSAPFRADAEAVCDAGSRILFAPDDVAATDSTLDAEVRVTWTDRSGFEDGYNVYRDGSLLATVAANVQSYSDTAAAAGVGHTYCVEAVDADGILSAQGCDAGSRGFVLPPLDVTASDGQYADRVVLTWTDQAPNETAYRITRDGVEIGLVAPGVESFEDLAPTSGTVHEYCVVTLSGTLASLAVCDTGGIDILPVPADLAVTLDVFDDRVELAWTDPAGFEDGFRIYRRDLSQPDSSLLATTAADAEDFTDDTALPGVDYRYCVATLSSVSGTDVESAPACATGRRARVLAPTDVAASDGTHENRVAFTWTNPATRAVLMNIYRVEADTTLIKTIDATLTSYEDFAQASGTVYTYCVAAVSEEAYTSAKVCDEGSRTLKAPTEVAAADGASEDFVEVTWVDNAAIEQGYRVYRQAAAEAFPALVGETGPSQTAFQDFTGTSGVTYTYRVVAFDAYSESAAGTDEGFRALAVPTKVAATDGDFEDRIRVSWIDNSRAEDGYRVYRRTLADEDSVVIGEMARNVSVFEDAGVERGETYRYSVVAFDAHGASEAGSDVGHTTLFAPGTFNASDTYTGRVVLSWIDQSAVEDGYQVLRNDVLIATTVANATTYIDSTATADVTYTYCVRATGGLAFSAEACDAGTAMADDPVPVVGDNDVAASDGAFDTRVQLTWTLGAGIDDSQGLRILRDGVAIDQLGAGATTYNDFDAAPGTLALYCVEAIATGSTVGCDFGWVPPDGSISGRVASQLGGGIGEVDVCLAPNPNKALLFDGEGGTAVVQGVTLPDSFSVELWMRPSDLAGKQDLIALPILRLGLTGGKLRVNYGTSSGVESAALLTTDWQHVALVVTQDRTGGTSTVQLYRDGILVSSAPFSEVLDTLPHEWRFGGDATNGDYFGGRLDEVRWWNEARTADEIAASAAAARALTGEEEGLLAYWPMDQGTGRIAGDRSGGNAHGALAAGVYWTDDSAPLDACARTDAEGNYTVAGLRYGSGTTFTVTPSLGVRRFDPAFKTITLNANSPVQNEVDFTDVSAFTISGLVQYEGTTCPVVDADIFLDGALKGKTEADGTYAVAADIGERVVEVRLGEAGDTHPFLPPSKTVTVEDDVSGVNFTDAKTRTLSGFFGGSCNTAIGTATIRIFTADGCFEKVIETNSNYAVELPPQKYLVQVTDVQTTNTQLKADILSFFDGLGAQEVDLTTEPDTLDLIYHAPLTLTISGFPSETAPGQACAADLGVPVLMQGQIVDLTLSVQEDYGNGQLCPVEEATFTIFDDIADIADAPIDTTITGASLSYTTMAVSPNVLSGRIIDGVDRSHQKALTVVAQVESQSVDEIAWVLVTGERIREGTFVTDLTSTDIPLFILRDPPGDQSYSYIEAGTKLCRSMQEWGFFNSLGFRSNFNTLFGDRTSFGLGVSKEFQIGAGLTTASDSRITWERSGLTNICFSTDKRFSTSADPAFVGEDADIYIGTGLNFTFAQTDVLSLTESCTVDVSPNFTVAPVGIETAFAYTHAYIRDTVIPQLEALKAAASGAEATRYQHAIDNWNAILALNAQQKADAVAVDSPGGIPVGEEPNRSFSAGADFESVVRFDTTFFHQWNVRLHASDAIGRQSVVDVAGNVLDSDFQLYFTRDNLVQGDLVGIGELNGDQTYTESQAYGYVLSDGDKGDAFTVNVKYPRAQNVEVLVPKGSQPIPPGVSFLGSAVNRGGSFLVRGLLSKARLAGIGTGISLGINLAAGAFDLAAILDQNNVDLERTTKLTMPIGSPIFELVSGASSCPVEPGTQSRDKPTLFMPTPLVTDVPADEPAALSLFVGNDSQSGERRRYILRTVASSNPNGAVIRANGSPIHEGLLFELDPGEVEVTLEVNRGATKYQYDSLTVELFPECAALDPKLREQEAVQQSFSVHFTSPCSDIAILRPKEDWVYDAAMAEANDSVEVILHEFMLQEADADPVETIGLEYRLQGTPDWLPALQVQASTLDPEATSYVAKWKPPADGAFEVRAFASCPAGTTVSDPFPGLADTKRPEPFGTPQPADEALALGDDIAVTFDEEIDCASVQTDGAFANVALTYLDGPAAGTAIPVEAVCDGRTLILEPQASDADLEGRLLEARLRSGVVDGQGNPVVVTDGAGNGIAQDIAWTFTVRRSAFSFSPVNVEFELTRGTGALVATSLVNGRAQPIDFTLPPSFDLVLSSDPTTRVPVAPSVTAGTLVAGGSKTIQLSLPDTLALGTYEGTLTASATDGGGADLGQTSFFLTTHVVCAPPAWAVDPAGFEYSMSLTAQLFFDGVASADTSDVLAAFVGNELRGVAAVQEAATGVYRVNMLLYSNVLSGEVVSFHAWDESTCSLFEETSKTLVFENGAVHGSFAQPVTIQAPPVVDAQAIPLAAGWTWFSLNKHPADTGVGAVLADVSAVEGDIVKSRTQFSLFDVDFGWVGTLPALTPGPGYLVKLQQSNSLTVTGVVADPAAEPIALSPGWNWIGYLPQAPLPINDALASLAPTAQPGDLIKSQFAFAQYVDNTIGWVGSLTTLEPGLAYQLQVANAGTLTYPTAAAAVRVATVPRLLVVDRTAPPRRVPKPDREAEVTVAPATPAAVDARVTVDAPEGGPDWVLDPRAYPHSMTLVAEVAGGEDAAIEAGARLALFAGDELRGLGTVRYVEALDRHLVFALIYGDEAADLTVRLYDPARDAVLDGGRLRFEPDAVRGSTAEPVRLAVHHRAAGLPTAFALEPAYPNPFNPVTTLAYALPRPEHVTLEVYDLIGRRVATLVDREQKAGRYTVRFEAGDLASGVYFYRIQAGTFRQTHKMVLLK